MGYLESRLLGLAAEARRAELDNSSASTLPSLSEADRADMEAFLGDMLLIYPVLGLLSSPSNAAMVLLGRTANGRIEWKTAAGVTLKEMQAASIEE